MGTLNPGKELEMRRFSEAFPSWPANKFLNASEITAVLCAKICTCRKGLLTNGPLLNSWGSTELAQAVLLARIF